MIFHIRGTCKCCGKAKLALIEVVDRDQLDRFIGMLEDEAVMEPLHEIEAIAPDGETVLAFYSALNIRWLRFSLIGWNHFPPTSMVGANRHREFVLYEYQWNLLAQ